jgi:WD40-like Beta Propeller Repeat
MHVPCRRLPGAFLAIVVPLIVSVGLPAPATAQSTGLVPYYGKNNIHYDTFQWYIYTTEHFEIYYYPSVEPHLERVAGYAESAYQQVSADLRHDLPFKVPMVLFKTHSEFEQQNIAGPDASSEGVLAFAEPTQHRMVLPIDSPPDELYGLIVHELTHQFEYDIVPVSLIRNNVPLWFYEGLSDYERGIWDPMDLMTIRDAAVADIVPKMSRLEGYGDTGNPRLIYNLGHAVFEFIEAKFGKEGLRNYLFALRKNAIGGGEDAYEEALQLSKDDFDQAFDKYLKDRFRPFRDKERPADYGRDLSPNQEKTKFAEALSIAPSPSGDLVAAVTINRKDQEIDIVLLSAKDGSIVRNLTSGFDKDMGFDHIVQIGQFQMPWVGWSPKGDRLAYFVRTEKERSLIVQNVLTRKIEYKIPMKTVDEPESPAFAPDGKTIAFAGLTGGVGDIFSIDLETGAVTNITNDEFAESGPTYAPDGSYLLYSSRVSGNQKLYRFDFATKKKTQITFGTHDDTAAEFVDDHTIVFSSTATDPSLPVDPAVAANGRIYNIWTLDLKTGELRQYTDALGGNWSPIVLNEGTTKKFAFVSYYKNEYSIREIEPGEPLHTAASSDFGEPGPVVDFQSPISHTLIPANQRKKRRFEKMFLEGRPPVNLGVTSNGDVFGGTQITLGDVLGDQQFNFFVSSIAQYRTMSLSYVNLSRRLQWAAQGFSETDFFYGQLGGVFYDPSLGPLISRDQAVATRTVRGGTLVGSYPLDRYRRLELSGGVVSLNEQFSDPGLQALANQQVFRNGTLIPLGAAFVQETTVFREFGPLAGNTMRLAYDYSPSIAGSLSRQTFDADARHYLRIGTTGVLATRLRGFRSSGQFPDFQYFGGNSEMHGYDYLSFVGQNVVFGDAELRFPIIEAALTPLGVVGGVRGMFFANMGAGWFDNTGFKWFARDTQTAQKFVGYATDPATGAILADPNDPSLPLAQYEPATVSGFRLQDARASYGIGLETFALGFPIHFDWSWRTLFNKDWEDVVFADQGGSAKFRKPRFAVWIGYDF